MTNSVDNPSDVRAVEQAEKVCLFDMDGTLCDYSGQLAHDLQKMASPHDPPMHLQQDVDPPPWVDERIAIVRSQAGWWQKLPPLDDGFAVLEMAVRLGFSPHVATKGPYKSPAAWSEKVMWCREQIDSKPYMKRPVGITVTYDKGLVYGRALVEDYPPYCERWLKWRKRGLIVLMDRSYNRDFNHPQVVRFDTSAQSYREVEERLAAAYARD